MNKLATLKSFFVILIAMGMAFSFKPRTSIGLIDVKGKAATCPSGQVSDECHVAADDQVCTFKFSGVEYKAVENDADDCANATVLHRPG